MKNNTFKRVLAGSLALLTVAAPMSANVEGVLQEVAIVASAADTKGTLNWEADMQDYIQSITIGEESISGTQVSKSTNYTFNNVAGVEVKIVTSVPINTWFATAFGGYVVDTEAAQKDVTYKFEKGHYKAVSEKDGVYTYEVYTKDDFTLTPDELKADRETFTWGFVDKTTGKTFSSVTDINTFITNADSKYKNSTSSTYEAIKDGNVVLEAATNFTVNVFDGSSNTSTINPDVEYDAEKKKYVSTFKMPTLNIAGGAGSFTYKDAEGTDHTNNTAVVIEIVAQDEEALTYTTKDNVLVANGRTVVADSVAAQITAKQKRAQVVDPETAAVIDEEIKESDLANNGTLKYGTAEDDGVTVTIKRDAKLTTKNTNAGSEVNAYAVFNVTKDGAVYTDATAKWENQNIGVFDAGQNADNSKNFTDENTYTFAKFKKAGDYVVTAKFFYKAANGGIDSKTITYKFTIAPIEVTAADATISFSYKDGDKEIAANTNDNKVTPKAVNFKDGVLEISVPDELKGTTFNGTVEVPMLDKESKTAFDALKALALNTSDATDNKYFCLVDNDGTQHFASRPDNQIKVSKDGNSVTFGTETYTLGGALPAVYHINIGGINESNIDSFDVKGKTGGTDNATLKLEAFTIYTIDGTLTATEFDKVNTVKLNIYEQNYGAPYSADRSKFKTINLQYKLVKAAQAPQIELLKDHPDVSDDKTLKVAASDTDLDTFTEIFWNNFKGNEIVEANKDKISFEYLEGQDRQYSDDDLDSHLPGVPNKKSDINYTLYVLYDGETFASVPLEVVTVKAMIVPDKAELTKTYGDEVAINKFTVQDSKGKALKNIKIDEVKVTVKGFAKDKDVNTEAIDPYKDVDGKYVLDTKKTVSWTYGSVQSLPAGTYVVTFDELNKDADADYTVGSEEYILVINKRTITADMFTATAAKTYNKKQQTVAINSFSFKYINDANNPEVVEAANMSGRFKVSGGDTKGTAAGEYTIKLTALDNNPNFTGTASVKWYIANTTNAKQNVVNFTWDPEKTLLYDAGRIHVVYDRTNDKKITETDADGKKYTVKDYGVIVDKAGKVAAPNFDSNNGAYVDYEEQKKGTGNIAAYDAAAAVLLYGNGFIEGSASEDCWERSDYGANIKVQDVETGMWVRPYALLNDDTVVYGKPIYLDITREAEKQLQFKLNPVKKLDKTNNLPGYDNEAGKYVFYSSYTKLDAEKVKATVKDFGVIVDKNGSFTTVNNAVVSADDKKTAIKDAFKCGEGFVEGHFNPDNEKLGANEYGAKIKPADFVTGVWVRGYIKLSDTLIVYTEPEYYNSVSDFYDKKSAPNATIAGYMHTAKTNDHAATSNLYKEDAVTPQIPAQYSSTTKFGVFYENATGKYKIGFQNKVKANDSKLEFVAQGVIIDKNEKLVNRTYNSNTSSYSYTLKDGAEKKLVLGNGFVEGKKTNAAADYNASITPISGKAIVVRPYTTFKVAGTDTTVTVYGNLMIQSVTSSNAKN